LYICSLFADLWVRKMKPKLEIIYSKSFNKALYTGFDFDEDWQDILAKGQYFEKYLDKYESAILRAIPKFTGVDWAKFKKGTVYIYIKHKEPDFIEPLVIPAKANPEVMLALLISKLVILNLNFKPDTDEESKQLDDIAHSTTLLVLESLGLGREAFLKYLDLYYLNEHTKSFQPLDFGRKKAKSYLSGV